MKYITKGFIIFIIFYFIIISFILYMMASGKIILDIKGFAVDSKNLLYVGKDNEILVINNGEVIRKLSPMTSRSYDFTIGKDDIIVIATAGDYVYRMNLDGSLIDKKEDFESQTLLELERNINSFVASNGVVYKMTNSFGYYKIIKNVNQTDKIIFRITPLSYSIKILLILLVLSFCSVITIIVIKTRMRIYKEKSLKN